MTLLLFLAACTPEQKTYSSDIGVTPVPLNEGELAGTWVGQLEWATVVDTGIVGERNAGANGGRIINIRWDSANEVYSIELIPELAASLTRYLTFGEIATEIGRDISVLSRDIRNAPGRQRSIAVLLEESCGYLQPDELEALESLVVFEGPFTAAAAHRVAGAPLQRGGGSVGRRCCQVAT